MKRRGNPFLHRAAQITARAPYRAKRTPGADGGLRDPAESRKRGHRTPMGVAITSHD